MADLLNRLAIDAIDVAPGKYFPNPNTATADDIRTVRSWWSERGIAIVGMQALLFGTSGLNLFAASDVQQRMLSHLDSVMRIAAGLGANRLVFGSPKNRDRTGLSDDDALAIAAEFFTALGDLAGKHDVVVCLEPNPPRYGANFMVSSLETAGVVRAVNHPSIAMQLDTGAMTLNAEVAEDVLANVAPLIGHIHASEPDLVPLGDATTDHAAIHRALVEYVPNRIVTIEMVATKESHLESVERALQVAIQSYQ